jgi:ubiE/COQ5 methyltransferase family
MCDTHTHTSLLIPSVCLRLEVRTSVSVYLWCQVLKPGGRLLCLEFSRVEMPLLRQVYDLYSFNVIPQMGRCADWRLQIVCTVCIYGIRLPARLQWSL